MGLADGTDMNERVELDRLLPEDPPTETRVEAVLGGVPALAIKGLFVLAVFYTIYFMRSLLLPIVLAVLFSLILYPAVRCLKRARIPEALGAAIVVGTLATLLVTGLYQLFEPATEWTAKFPRVADQVERKLWGFRKSVEQVSKAAEKVEALTTVNSDSKQRQPPVMATQPSLMSRVLAGTQNALVSSLAMLVLLYFLLAWGDFLLRKFVSALPTWPDKRKAVGLAHTIQSAMARYLFTISVINAVLGISSATAMYLLGMPNPMLWGVMVALFNYVPYVGQAICGAVLTMVAFLTFEDLQHVMLVPIVHFAMVTIEGQFITPILTGRTLTLNPVMIFLSMLFWGWMWGMVGALIAVPILMTFKILCEHIVTMKPLAEFLSGKREEALGVE
jgi:predicted PurR-regulated permease PerM